ILLSRRNSWQIIAVTIQKFHSFFLVQNYHQVFWLSVQILLSCIKKSASEKSEDQSVRRNDSGRIRRYCTEISCSNSYRETTSFPILRKAFRCKFEKHC